MARLTFQCNHHVATFTKRAATTRSRFDVVCGEDYRLSADPIDLPRGDYRFKYDYPLTRRASFVHGLDRSASIVDVLKLAKRDYQTIYALELMDAGDPGNIPGMLNRARSNGRYGIWGHVLSDLYFEIVAIDTTRRTVNFGMGS